MAAHSSCPVFFLKHQQAFGVYKKTTTTRHSYNQHCRPEHLKRSFTPSYVMDNTKWLHKHKYESFSKRKSLSYV